MKMLCRVASHIPTTCLILGNISVCPEYSEETKWIIVNSRIKCMDLFDYFMMIGDRSNMISYIKDGFTKYMFCFKYFDVLSYTDIIYEVLPDIVNNGHVDVYLAHLSEIEDLCFHHFMMLYILYPYANTEKRQRLVDIIDMDNSITPTQVKGRTLQYMLDILPINEFNSLYNSSISYQDIYSPIWGANTLLIKYIADNACPEHRYSESIYLTCRHLTYGTPNNYKEIMWPGQLELVVNYYEDNIEDLITSINNLPMSLTPRRYSHKYNALLLCCDSAIGDEESVLDDFILDGCEYCRRISLTHIKI